MNTVHEETMPVDTARHMWNTWESREYRDSSSYTLMNQSLLMQDLVYHTLRECVVARLRRISGYHTFDKVVDLGCATGEWTLAYKRFARKVVGVDINSAFIAEARQRAHGRPDIEDIEFTSQNLVDFKDYAGADLVCSGGCLMYVDEENLHEMFETIRREMVPGGYFYIRVSVANPRRKAYESTRGFYRKPSFYETLFQAHGFEILDSVTSGGVIGHEVLRESVVNVKGPVSDAALLRTVKNAVLVKQVLFNGKKNAHMNWIARRVSG